MTQQDTVIGVFTERTASAEAIQALKQGGFDTTQLGFLARRSHRKINSGELGRGIVGGILGGVDMLILPFTGPADAIGMLEGTLPAAENALDRLLAFHAHRESQGEQPTPATTDDTSDTTGQDVEAYNDTEDRTGVAAGSIAGGVVGAGAALLIPGIGPAIAGGVLTVLFAGAAAGGIAGGFLGAFADLGVPQEKARYYEREFKAGNIIVTVTTNDQAQEQHALDILRQRGAHDVEAHAKV
ncbi:MAG TPA: hypothetical protein VHZ51_28415 [Ktedonobacteraceae bacterium]|jgi:hypothetical protein|nr:hypothetical protein [Ktedonobacteraceae bacterium]